MRNEIQEPGRGILSGTTRANIANARQLEASVVDAAMDDDAAPIVAERGSRRDFPSRGADAAHVSIDESHAAVVSDGALIRQLSQQLTLLEAQQTQIRRLLEITERQFATSGEMRIDR